MSNSKPEDEMDRLSDLSEPLLLQIISLLPFKFSVRTSILARRFRHLYKATASVKLDRSEFPDGRLFNGVTSRYLRLRDSSAPLRSFSLKAWIGRPFTINLLKKWLNRADSLGMRHLSLHLQTATIETIFPFFIGFQSLQSLVIDDVDIDYIFGGYKFEPLIPHSFSQTQLKYLRIKAKMSPSDLRLLILGLSNLEYLSIQPTRQCEVDMSPSVKILKITSDTFAQPHQLTLHIDIGTPYPKHLVGAARKWKQNEDDLFHPLVEPGKDMVLFPNLRSLRLSMCFYENALQDLICLLRHSPVIDSLHIIHVDRPSDCIEQSWAPEFWHSKLPRNSEGNRKYADFTNLLAGDKKSEAIKLLCSENPSKRLKTW